MFVFVFACVRETQMLSASCRFYASAYFRRLDTERFALYTANAFSTADSNEENDEIMLDLAASPCRTFRAALERAGVVLHSFHPLHVHHGIGESAHTSVDLHRTVSVPSPAPGAFPSRDRLRLPTAVWA